MNICEHLTVTARLFPEREALAFEGQSVTYARLDGLSMSAAHMLTDAGIRPGDRVAMMLPNVPAFVVWYYATLRVGAIAVSVSTRLTASEVAFVVGDCIAKVFVASDTTLETVLPELPKCVAKTISTSDSADISDGQPLDPEHTTLSTWIDTEPEDCALILYTSGTTGFAKGAKLSHRNVRSNVHAFNHLCNMQPDDRILLAVPLFHCFGQNALLNSAFNVGATLVLQRRFDLNEARRLIVDERVTQLYGVPMMFQLLLGSCDPPDLASVSYCFSAAATLPLQVSVQWQEKFGMPLNEGYGLTETSPFASYNHRLQFVPGSIGTPIDLVEMKIVDTETGEPCAPGELGEIAIRGPNVMLGYWNREADTKAAIRDGWFHSGDIGRVDEKGFFYIVDRVKDMIAVGGLNVYPAEVERVLLDLVDVSQAAVVGIPNDVFGEQVVAFVVLKDGSSKTDESRLADITRHSKLNLANYKVPRKIVPIDELPHNPSGKVLKTKLREYDLGSTLAVETSSVVAATSNDSGAPPSQDQLREPTLRQQLESTHASCRTRVATTFLQNLVQVISGRDDLPEPEARFLDAGLDSLMIVEMSDHIQVAVGPLLEVPSTLVFDHPRICDLADYLVTAVTEDESTDETKPSEPSYAFRSATRTLADESKLQQQIESMSEQEVIAELMRELEG